MMWARLASAAVLTVLMIGCGTEQRDSGTAPAAQDPAKDTVFKDMVGTMDKARSVEDTAAQQQRQLEQALEQAEGK